MIKLTKQNESIKENMSKTKSKTKLLRRTSAILSMLAIATVFSTNSASAASHHSYTDGTRQEGKISANRINRIKFGDVPLTQVIGDESKYNIVLDERAVNMFLTAKVPAGEQVDLFLINAAGEVADLNLKVANIDSQTLEIGQVKVASSKIEKNEISRINGVSKTKGTSEIIEDSEINLMLDHMIAGRKDKYYVTNLKRKIPSIPPVNLEIVQDQTYRYGNLTGARLKVTNRSYKEGVILTNKSFATIFKNSKAICIENKLVKKGKSTNVWIITLGDDK